MTVALAIVLFATLMIYCGVKGKSLKHALVGRSTQAASGSLLGAS